MPSRPSDLRFILMVRSGMIVSARSSLLIAFSAHFDGKVIVPEHAVDLPFVVHVETPGSTELGRETSGIRAAMAGRKRARRRPANRSFRPARSLLLRHAEGRLILPAAYFADTTFWIALFRARDRYHSEVLAWQRYLAQSGTLIVTTEAVCWTRTTAALGFERISHDPRIEVVPHSRDLSADAIRLFAARSDKN